MICTVLSTSFFCYYGVLTLPLHHTFYLCLKKEKMVVTHYITCPTADAGLPATKQFYTTINRLRKYSHQRMDDIEQDDMTSKIMF